MYYAIPVLTGEKRTKKNKDRNIACRRSLTHIQRLLDCLEEALAELEDLAGIAR